MLIALVTSINPAETGWYYLKSRYYDPEVGRFINADDVDVLNIGQNNFLQYNMYIYCFNNSVNNFDKDGYFSLPTCVKGVGNIATGVTAIMAGIAVVSCGVAAPVMLCVAAITIGAGVLTAINGTSDIGEAITGKNYIKNSIFKGNEEIYNKYSSVTKTVAAIGSAVCGGWLAANQPRITAYNNIQNYKYTKTISDSNHMQRPYNNSVLMQKQIIKYGKMKKDTSVFGYVFTAKGSVNNGKESTWRLGVNVMRGLVWHFGHGF